MLTPLQQFVCDTCGEVIESPQDGWVEWLHGGRAVGTVHSFRICHVEEASPKRQRCQIHNHSVDCAGLHLVDVLPRAANWLYQFLGVGHLHEPQAGPVMVRDMREFLDFARRLTVPYYEEARKFWDDAVAEGVLDGHHEISAYEPETLQGIVERFGPYGGSARGMGATIIPLPVEIAVFVEKLHAIVGAHDWSSPARPPAFISQQLTVLGKEIHRSLGHQGMVKVFDAVQRHLPRRACSRINYSWNGIGDWMV